jgi:L-threonylcarbamoyladenylate synthase
LAYDSTMRILRLSEAGIESAAREAALILASGGIVLYPTDTLYGLAVNALDRGALERLKDLKGREKKKPISVVVPDIESMNRYGVLNDSARSLAERFLPGPLTLVVPGTSQLPEELMLNGALGMRIPNDPYCLALAALFKAPYTATSANISGHLTPTTAQEVLAQFGSRMGEIDLVIDDGPREGGIPSTVVTCVTDTPHVLREGALSKTALGL